MSDERKVVLDLIETINGRDDQLLGLGSECQKLQAQANALRKSVASLTAELTAIPSENARNLNDLNSVFAHHRDLASIRAVTAPIAKLKSYKTLMSHIRDLRTKRNA